MIIYKVTNIINNHSYIGQTVTSLSKRKAAHLSDVLIKKDSTYFHRAIRKYGVNDFEWSIIDECSAIEELNRLEIYYIGYYDTFDNGYNLTLGGEGSVGFKHTEESIKIMSEKAKERFKNPENHPNFGKPCSQKIKDAVSKANKGRKKTKQERARQSIISKSAWQRGSFDKRRSYKGNKNPAAKNYIITTPEGEEIYVDCLKEFGKKYGITVEHFSSVASGKRKQHRGYTCRYAN